MVTKNTTAARRKTEKIPEKNKKKTVRQDACDAFPPRGPKKKKKRLYST